MVVAVAGCGRKAVSPESSANASTPSVVLDDHYLKGVAVGLPVDGRPWIAHVNPVDLDQDGLMDIVVCDGRLNTVSWVRQVSRGHFAESVLSSDCPAPVHAEAVDIDGDGDLDLLVACMGQVFPNNAKIGSVVVLENDGHEHFIKHVLADNIARVTDVRAGDFNGDGRLDLAVAQFGYDQGEVRWMENRGNWNFESHTLLDLSGAINVLVADMDGNHTPDIVTVVSQQWEEVYLFSNDGAGNFTRKVIGGSTNEDYGSSGISLCDLNRDGKPDILYSNGDGFDYAEPGPRPWHGLQWLENLGDGFFRNHRIGDLPGAYSPVGVDLDGDGAMDVVAVSGFNDWKNPGAASLVVFQNDGHENFTRHVLAHTPTHLMTAAAADMDGDGKPELITGGFHAYPPWDHMSRVMVWSRVKP